MEGVAVHALAVTLCPLSGGLEPNSGADPLPEQHTMPLQATTVL